jgi:hypothetical protein
MHKQTLLKYKFLCNFNFMTLCQFKDSLNGTAFSDFLKCCSLLTEVIIDGSPESLSSAVKDPPLTNTSIRYVFVARTLTSVLNCHFSANMATFRSFQPQKMDYPSYSSLVHSVKVQPRQN